MLPDKGFDGFYTIEDETTKIMLANAKITRYNR
jgi:hypothetical protein